MIIYLIPAVYRLALPLLTCLKSCHELLCVYPFLFPWACHFRVWNDFYSFVLFDFHHHRELVPLSDWDDGFYFSLKCKYLTHSMHLNIFINEMIIVLQLISWLLIKMNNINPWTHCCCWCIGNNQIIQTLLSLIHRNFQGEIM